MSLKENKAIVRSIFEDGLNKGEVDKVAEMTAPDFFDHDIHVETGIPGGPKDLREALLAIRRGFPDTGYPLCGPSSCQSFMVRDTARDTNNV